MPTYRIGIGSELNLKDRKVGVGSETPVVELDVAGTLKHKNSISSGVATFTRYTGLAADNLTFDGSITGEYQTTSDIVVGIGKTFTISVGSTVNASSYSSVVVVDHFSPPTGGIEDRPEVPIEGMVRFNNDLNTLEFYNGVDWRQFTVSGASGRGVCAGRTTPTTISTIDYIQISTIGNAINFGDLTSACQARAGGYSDGTRGVFCGGSKPGFTDDCDYITIPSAGNGIDFGNLTSARDFVASCSSSTRGITAGGRSGSPATAQNIIEYAELQTIGNHIDFGDLSVATHIAGAGSSPTRAVFAGGGNDSDVTISTIQTVNFAAKGNAVKFGDLTVAKRPGSGGCSNSVRALFGGGYTPGVRFNNIDVLNLASGGNTIQGGNLDRLIYSPMGLASQTRAVFAGGQNDSGTKINTIQYVNISTLGNTVHFGELTAIGRAGGTASDSHGGLGGY